MTLFWKVDRNTRKSRNTALLDIRIKHKAKNKIRVAATLLFNTAKKVTATEFHIHRRSNITQISESCIKHFWS